MPDQAQVRRDRGGPAGLQDGEGGRGGGEQVPGGEEEEEEDAAGDLLSEGAQDGVSHPAL